MQIFVWFIALYLELKLVLRAVMSLDPSLGTLFFFHCWIYVPISYSFAIITRLKQIAHWSAALFGPVQDSECRWSWLWFWLPSSPSNRFHIIMSPLTNNLNHCSFLFMQLPKVIIENNSYLSVYLWIFNSLLLIYSAYL